jgi:hypothetical protein
MPVAKATPVVRWGRMKRGDEHGHATIQLVINEAELV